MPAQGQGGGGTPSSLGCRRHRRPRNPEGTLWALPACDGWCTMHSQVCACPERPREWQNNKCPPQTAKQQVNFSASDCGTNHVACVPTGTCSFRWLGLGRAGVGHDACLDEARAIPGHKPNRHQGKTRCRNIRSRAASWDTARHGQDRGLSSLGRSLAHQLSNTENKKQQQDAGRASGHNKGKTDGKDQDKPQTGTPPEQRVKP